MEQLFGNAVESENSLKISSKHILFCSLSPHIYSMGDLSMPLFQR